MQELLRSEVTYSGELIVGNKQREKIFSLFVKVRAAISTAFYFGNSNRTMAFKFPFHADESRLLALD